MQLLQAGSHKFILLEFDADLISNLIRQAGYEFKLEDYNRHLVIELTAPERESPLLLFDAADPGNLGWFSRCQFYIDGSTGMVLQTPIRVANQRDRFGEILPNAVRLQLAKELPSDFRLPGKQPVNEQVVYALLFNLLTAMAQVGVAVCGGGIVRPLAGRTESVGVRN
jgi:hypothetical protein